MVHAVGSGGVGPRDALPAASRILPQVIVACLGDLTPASLLHIVLGPSGM